MQTLRQDVEQALRTYLSEPGAAAELATAAHDESLRVGDWVTASMALRALGLVAGHTSDSTTAVTHLSAAVALAHRGGDPARAAEAGADLAYALARQGRTEAALHAIADAEPHLLGTQSGRLLMMRALVLKSLGRWDEALAAYDRAVPAVRAGGDREDLGVLLGNRAVAHMHLGSLLAAERDLRDAASLLNSSGQELRRAIMVHNLGYVASLRGDVVAALTHFDEAERGYREHRDVPLELWRDRCELLLAAGLWSEAREAAGRAVETARARGEAAELAEARLRLAEAALRDGDPETARAEADTAARAFARQRRSAWSALARWVVLQACLDLPDAHVPSTVARRAASRLSRAGFVSAGLEARLVAARLAVTEGRPDVARRDLTPAVSRGARGSITVRLCACRARAMLCEIEEDPAGVRRAAAQGLALVARHRASLGALDLRAAAAARVADLSGLALRAALRSGRPTGVLAWAERTRAASLALRAARPPEDPELARDLAALRQVVLVRTRAVESGSGRRLDLEHRQHYLEARIRDRARLLRAGSAERASPPDAHGLSERLGERALVEYVTSEGRLHAVTLVDGRARLHDLGAVDSLEGDLQALRSGMRWLLRHHRSGPAVQQTLWRSLTAAAGALDARLLVPLRRAVGSRPLVVVPTSPLQAVPWALLPGLTGRTVCVAPTAALWHAAAGTATTDSTRTVFVAGPGLEHAAAEVERAAKHYADAEVLVAEAGTGAAVLAGMEGSRIVHVAAHGVFRADNPLFSYLNLHDGPLNVYDLLQVRQPPDTVVLSACESARTAVLAGDEVLGLTTALLGMGVRSLVASVVEVPDAETSDLMDLVHRELALGHEAGVALAAAQRDGMQRSPREAVAAAAFICLGA